MLAGESSAATDPPVRANVLSAASASCASFERAPVRLTGLFRDTSSDVPPTTITPTAAATCHTEADQRRRGRALLVAAAPTRDWSWEERTSRNVGVGRGKPATIRAMSTGTAVGRMARARRSRACNASFPPATKIWRSW